MGLNPAAGDPGFGGTSGASAIIAGAAIVLQGIARARGTELTPSRMRDLLSGPFNTSSPDPIGVMPDLEQAGEPHLIQPGTTGLLSVVRPFLVKL
jgi:hypothetical protein